jgi:hypothetical protein
VHLGMRLDFGWHHVFAPTRLGEGSRMDLDSGFDAK